MADRLNRFSAGLDRWAGAAGRWAETNWLWAMIGAVGGGLFLALLAPLSMAAGLESVARPIYRLYSLLCHQIPERTLWLAGHPMAFCARDTGLYGGLWLGMVVVAAGCRPRLSVGLALALAVPLVLDGGSQLIGLRESVNWLRLVTGSMAGVSAVLYVLPRMVQQMRLPAGSSVPAVEDTLLSRTCREA